MANGNVGFIGLGKMGRPMTQQLLKAGFEVTVHNRSRGVVDELAKEGAKPASSPREVAEAGDFVLTCLPDPPTVEAIYLGDDGIAAGGRAGQVWIDHSTVSPATNQRCAEAAVGRGAAFLDAPVSGSRPKAEGGTLTIMVGGEAEAFERARPLFEAMGELVIHVGPQGHGAMAKLVNNTLAAVNAVALAEGITLARAGGLDIDAALRVVAAGSGELAATILARAHEAGVPVREDPALAETLASLAVGSEVPEELWMAVARVLVWAYELEGRITPNR